MKITAADVAKLRKMTGAGMMDCKQALIETNGDFDKAKDIIREKGKLVAAKRADRETTEGAVVAKSNDDNTVAILVSLGCETDFVAKNEEFQQLAEEIAQAAVEALPEDLEGLNAVKMGDLTIEEAVTQQTGKSGEKHTIPFYGKLEAPYISTYIHNNGKLGTLVGFSKEIPYEAGRDIAMQITAMNPISISRAECPQEVIDKEMEIFRVQTREEGRPENLIEQIVQGKLNRFFKENTLEDQTFVKDGKISVKEYLKTIDPEVKVVGFHRFSLTD